MNGLGRAAAALFRIGTSLKRIADALERVSPPPKGAAKDESEVMVHDDQRALRREIILNAYWERTGERRDWYELPDVWQAKENEI